jgi:diguanylate cyclase (GGDEF)-like protein/PAS domain S-box-containing protein
MADLALRLTVVNPALCTILARSSDELLGHRIEDFVHPLDVTVAEADGLIVGGQPPTGAECRVLRPDGSVRWIEHTLFLVRDANQEPDRFFAQVQDITSRKTNEHRLSHQALHDPLTGLPNRLLLLDRIRQALARRRQGSGRVVALFLDLDRFKLVNDELGHAAGDVLLVQIATRLSSVLRAGDTLSRFGGDEFVIVYDEVDPGDAERLGERIAGVMREQFVVEGRPVSMTASIGIMVASPDDDAMTLIRHADEAMYAAKRTGRARSVVFQHSMRRQATVRRDAEASLRRAFDLGELRVHFQPIMDIATDRPVELEALVRWQHVSRGLVDPMEFIPIAEQSGLIVPIGEWILRDALRQAAGYRRQVPGAEQLSVAVNLSARQLRDANLLDVVRSAIEETGIAADAVTLEIPEALVMNDSDLSLGTLHALRSLGVRLAVDDFGTGYCSFSYLKQLPVNVLKIDRSFIRGLGGIDPHDTSIVSAIVRLAHGLGLDVVAEGVETAEQRDELRRMGRTLGQGFLWSRPLTSDDVSPWLRDHRIGDSSQPPHAD